MGVAAVMDSKAADGVEPKSISVLPLPLPSTPLSSAEEVEEEDVAASIAAMRFILCSSFLVFNFADVAVEEE